MAAPVENNQENIIEQVVQQFINAQLQGQEPDIDEFVKQYPELGDQIRERIQNFQRINGLFDCLMQADDSDFGDAITEHDLVGQRLGDFEVLSLIGTGGMGAVFLARQISLDRDVALKVISDIRGARGKSLERFKREAKVLAKISHPNIVPIYEVGEQGPYSYFAMEHVAGVSLDKILSSIRKAHPDEKASDVMTECLEAQIGIYAEKEVDSGSGAEIDTDYIVAISRIIVSIASALEYAHNKSILHRDIKPSNILIASDGTAKLVDFGLARAQTQQTITISGEFFGTPSYVSPEQIRKPETVDCRSDVYSLAATYYECLTLHPPFEGDTVNETLTRVVSRPAVPPKKYCPRLSADFNTVLLHALEKLPDDRYRSAADLAADIKNVLDFRPITAKRPSITRRTYKALRRNPLKIAIIGISISLIVLGYVLSSLYLQERKITAAGRLYADGISKIAEKKYAEALECFMVALEKDPTHVQAAWLAASCCQDLDDHEGAIRLYKRALENDPKCARAYQGLGDAYRVLGEHEKAIEFYRQSIVIEPNSLAAHGNLAMSYEARGEYAEAIESYKCVLSIDPDHEGTLLRLAGCYHSSKHYTEAEEACRKLLRLKPNDPVVYGMLASAQKECGALDDAVKSYERAVDIDPNFSSMYFAMGVYYQEANRHEEAIEPYRMAVQSDPNNTDYKLALAGAYQICERYQEAIASYKRYLDAEPNDAATYRRLGYCLSKSKRYDEALKAYGRSIELEPGNATGYSSLGWCYWELGQYEHAIKHSEEALRLDPADLQTLGCLGASYQRLGDNDRCIEFCKTALEIDPNYYSAYSHLGGAYMGKGMHQEAINATEKYLTFDPNYSLGYLSLAL